MLFNKSKKISICGKCYHKLEAEGKKLKVIYGGIDCKVSCMKCGRRRYGAVYEEVK